MSAAPSPTDGADAAAGVHRLGWSPRLRTVLLLVVLGAGIYTAALPIYLVVRITVPARALGQGTESFLLLLEDQQRRAESLHRAADLGAVAVRSRAALGSPVLDSLKSLATAASVRTRAQPYAAVAPRQGALLASTDDQMSRVANTLIEASALVELDRWESADRRLQVAHDESDRLDSMMSLASSVGRGELVQRQEALAHAGDQTWLAAVIWFAVGVALLPFGVALLRQRIWRPLAELESGLALVSEGDLSVQLPLGHDDELGKVRAHFNTMTRVQRQRAEERGRFVAAGQLVAGVAHEVSNPLMAIIVHAESHLSDPALDPAYREESREILRQARRASKLLRGLLRFVRPRQRRVTHVPLEDVVRDAVELVAYRFRVEETELHMTLPSNLPHVLADSSSLEQVMVNLLSNGIDAMREAPKPRRLCVEAWSEESSVCVAVSDTGRGVSPEFEQELFKPFTTTKGKQGTGLGLYISRQIVRETGGDLRFIPGQGAGARFVVSLQVAEAASPRGSGAHERVPDESATPRSDGDVRERRATPLADLSVLVVDDEEPIRRPLARYLERRGARVVQAGDGREALDLLDECDVDLVIADLRMPVMNGLEFHAHLCAHRPRLAECTMILSGDIAQLSESDGLPIPPDRIIEKPVELTQLEERILRFLSEMA